MIEIVVSTFENIELALHFSDFALDPLILLLEIVHLFLSKSANVLTRQIYPVTITYPMHTNYPTHTN